MNILDTLKTIALRFIDLLVLVLAFVVGVSLLSINGAFISNIANCIMADQYWDISIGVQVVLVIVALVWLPIFIIKISPGTRPRQ